MSNVAEFIKVREKIESLATEMDALIGRKILPESKIRLDEAGALLTKLTEMADNDVQQVAVVRLTRLLTKLGLRVGALKLPRRATPSQKTPAS